MSIVGLSFYSKKSNFVNLDIGSSYPCLADLINHLNAFLSSSATPSPFAYDIPTSFCAGAYPSSADFRCQPKTIPSPFVNKCNQQACFVGQALLLLNSVTAAHGNVA
jgi:hypothetical protein